MSAICYDAPPGWPSYLGTVPRFSFYEQAVVEQPAPVRYVEAQRALWRLQTQLSPDFHYEVARRAALNWQRHRPWWLGVC